MLFRSDHSSVIWTCSSCNSNHLSATSPATLHDLLQSTQTIESLVDLSIDSLDDQHQPVHESSPRKYKPPPANNGRSLRVINVNCQSLASKKGAWINLLHSTRPDVIIATETWLDDTIRNSELESDSYTIYRRDRKTGIHGGVMIAVNSAITSTEVEIKSEAEILWVKLQCKGHRDIYIASCYRPNVSDKTFNTHLRKSLDQLMSKRPRAFIIGGDFNLPGWDWSSLSLKPGTQYTAQHTDFRDLLDDFGLTQCVIEPTRQKNILDLIATNLTDQVNRIKVIPGISDHEVVYLELAVMPSYRKQPQRKIWLYNKADWAGMVKHLQPIMNRLEQAYTSPDELWLSIKQHVTEAMTIFIPKCLTKRKDSRPWISKQLHKLITKKKDLYRKCKRRGSSKLEKRYNAYRHIVQKMLRKQHTEYVNKLFTDEDKSKDELSKRFWTYVKHKRSGTTSGVGPLKRGNQLVTSAKEKAELLNDQFVSVFSDPSDNIDYTMLTLNSKMKNIVIDQNGVHKQLKSLNPHKAAGPDGISPRVLQELADVLAAPLTTLFQTSLDKATVPNDWKKASVCPIFKKGEKSAAANYRPVSLTCVTSKIMEHILTSQLMRFAEENDIFHQNQHGFRRNHGCEKQLIELVSDITTNLDKGKRQKHVSLTLARHLIKSTITNCSTNSPNMESATNS